HTSEVGSIRQSRQGTPVAGSSHLFNRLQRQHRQRAVEEREAAFGGADRGAGARRVVVVALHGLFELLVRELDPADQLDAVQTLLAGVSLHVSLRRAWLGDVTTFPMPKARPFFT